MGQINKGKIATIEGNFARVIPSDATAKPTAKIMIPWHLRGDTGQLKKGTEVVYAEFDDSSGLLLGRVDGEWGEYLPKLKSKSVIASGISLENHIHGNVKPGTGESGGPK